MTNTTLPNSFDALATGRSSSEPFVDAFHPRDPTTSDTQYPIQKKWLNTSTNAFWELKNFTSSGGVTLANWVLLSNQSSDTETLTGNDHVVVPPTGNNINVVGDGVAITTTGNAATSTLTINLLGNVATTYVEDTGSATPSGGVLNVLGTGLINTTGSGNTITIDLTNAPLLGLVPDAHTAPGTSPVVPNGSGNIIATGNQVAAGTTSNVIRTDSLAANTITVEIQRSQAVASSTVGDNGVCHFNSNQFVLDSNAFVSFPSTTIFLPTIFGSTSAGTATYVEQAGRYQVVGNWVIININLQWTGHTGTGNMMVGNFPFTFAASQSFYPSVCMMQNITFPASTSWVVVNGVNNTTTAAVTASISNASFSQVQMSAAGSLHATVIYPYA